MKKEIKVMEFFGEPLNYGGQEAFIFNMYSHFSKKLDITFVTPFEATNSKLINLINKKNDALIYDNKPFETNLRKKNILETANKYINDSYDVIHIHSGSLFTLYTVSKLARKKGVRKVIVHAHSTGGKNLKGKIIKFLSRDIDKFADTFIGCTEEVGFSKFPKRIVNGKNFFVVNNGIDVEKFIFNEKLRNDYRKKFNVENKTVLINIGRFCYEKNQKFIIELFHSYITVNKNAHLFLVGGMGEEFSNINNLIKELNLEDYVTILLNRDDINNLLFMSDVFLLPSFWEGLPVTGVEAQASGIPCIFSDRITEKINLTKSFYKLSLDVDVDVWIKLIDKLKLNKRENNIDLIKNSGFNCEKSAIFLENLYLEKGEIK